jgi:hypothetical protein
MTQSKIITSLAVVAVLVLVGFVAFWPGKIDTVVNTDSEQAAQQEQQDGKKKAFSEFLKEGGTYKCTVHQYVNDTDTTGTAYIHDGMIRGEYATSVQGRSIEATVIVRDGYAHSWTSMAPTMGFRSKVETDPETGATGTTGTYSYNTDQIGDYDCQPWTADSSKFELPAGVTFREA